ncbi:DnaD domain protein [Tissierella praeacuta]|uniref:DnaD and phage-associated domain-containing protein n=1 Tax=Tissierella praeacuta DSM 18095 TaxID=1123404 RepID=A0A1M4Y2X1_9FIRM|nr:DnaD domain protein [Tissierella praeacuta]HAE92794.1 DnaD domain protein [Tissierella sp.]MBU5256456.1 DnaD domain protein [Tissierella praeacuta]TCU79489.1 DnaD/phage-associated family protein [Tissierella praeacuta]SHF00174.1 DnaD and phage-associated domain-containing protein [Tissierella praeacuta DSM 18095]SUO98880.1 DnaD domain protein [Tissierella praeacuta]
MSFTLETTDMDLGDTPIENIFINDFMPMANGTYVKVYLLGYKYAHDRDEKIEVNNKTIAKHLEIPLEDVLRAWDFWESKGIIKKIPREEDNKYNYKVKFLNLKQLYIKNNLSLFNSREEIVKKPKSITPQELIDANQIPAINKMFNQIDYIMRRQTVTTEKQKVLSWIENYNMNPDVIEKAFFYGVERKGQRNVNYIEGIIRNWYDSGLTNMDAVIEYFKNQDEKFYRYQKVMRALGFDNRSITQGEMKVIDKWFEEYKFSLEIVLKGCEASSKVSNPSVNYIDGVLKSWYEKDIKTLEDIELKDKPKEKKEYSRVVKPTQGKIAPFKTRFHNFEQRTDKYTSEELETIARRKREAYNQKVKGEV